MGAGTERRRLRASGAESALLNYRTEFLLCSGLRPSLRTGSRVARVGPTSMRKPLSRPERDDHGTSQTSIYERAFVKRGRCGFCVAGLPHIPFRRRLRSIWPISDLSADEWSCDLQHIL